MPKPSMPPILPHQHWTRCMITWATSSILVELFVLSHYALRDRLASYWSHSGCPFLLLQLASTVTPASYTLDPALKAPCSYWDRFFRSA